MATRFEIEHIWNVPRQVVLDHMFDEEIGRRCNAALRSAERSRLSLDRHDDGRVVQRFSVKASDVPAAARKVLKPEMLQWVEESVWHPDRERFTWRIELNVMRDKVDCRGEQWYVDLGDRTRRVVSGTIEIRIPLAGKIAEKVIVGQLEQSYREASPAESGYYAERYSMPK